MMLLDALARHGDRPAVEAADGRVTTYAELLALARRSASPALVELPASRTVDFLARCLGAWLGGGAFRPFDPCDPRPRPPIEMRDGLAYVIATSGSTGTPKHVLVGHGGLPALWTTQVDAFALAPGARALWLHAPLFDASISDWGTALLAGATLVLPTARAVTHLADELAARDITHVDLPPPLLPQLDRPPACVRVVVLGGEACDVERVRALAHRVRVVVVYGPTEATVCSSLVAVDPARWTRPLIGHPLPGVGYHVVGGELYIAGEAALAYGYANDAAETARCFVDVDGTRMYRTGDRVASTPAGLAFVGRVDRQVKLRGRRIELDEVEATLRRFVDDAAVVVRGHRLAAFVTSPVDRAALAAVLPRWMMPSRFVVGPLPRTPTGKVDRAALERCALPPPRIEVDAAGDVHAFALAWCTALGVDSVRLDDRFSEVGGDSLARLMLRIAMARGGPDSDALLDGDPTFGELVTLATRAGSHVNALVGAGDQARRLLTVAACEARGLAMLDTLLPQRARASRPAGDPRTRPSTGAPRTPRDGDLLITGVNGQLGRALVVAWRRRAPARRIIGLVRDPDVSAAELGVDELVRGDVRDDAWHDAVRGRVAAVVHCAATIQLGGDWDAHVDGNVRGTAQIARLVGDDIAWHHISTLSVFVHTDHARGRHEPRLNPVPGAIAYGGYAQTKIAAEAIARACGASIYRLGLLTGSLHDQRAMTLRALVKLGAAPAGFRDQSYDETPVAYAAEAIVAHAADGPATFHIAAGSTRFGDVIERMRLAELPHAVWLERAQARLDDPDVAMAIGAFSRRQELDLFLTTHAELQ